MALSQLQKLELNKRVDKILYAPTNNPISGQQLEMAFVVDMDSDIEYVDTSLRDAVISLKMHDKTFQNVRSNIVYWEKDKIYSKVMPMSFLQIGKAFEDIDKVDNNNTNVEKTSDFGKLCEYLKLFQARSRCVLVFTQQEHIVKKIENLNPFLKYRILLITPEKMITGTQLHMDFIREQAK